MSNDLATQIATLGLAMQQYQAAVDDFDREMARVLHVNRTDLRCLEILISKFEDDITPREIAAQLDLTPGSVTTMLDRLEAVGYVVRSPHADDRRKVLVRATSAVRDLANSMIAPLLKDSESEITAHFSATELGTVERFIKGAAVVQRRHTERLRSDG